MDIARLPIANHYASGYPTSPGAKARREPVLELVTEVAPAGRARDSVEKVVQGEVLQRERATHYSATHDYLHSRQFDGDYSRDSGQRRADVGLANRALGAYQSHTRELIQPNANRGRGVDYFI